jgi:chromate transporter
MADSNDFNKTGAPGMAQIAAAFIRYANFTLGGGSATVAVLHRKLLDKRRWISNDNFSLCFALARLTPGTNLLAFCTGVGWLLRSTLGAMTALLAASIPCTIIVALATALFSRWQENHWAQAAIHGAIAAAVAITVKTC